MSYCRFSSDDFQCDVYAYESVGGFIAIHVAAQRYVFKESPPEPIELDGTNFEAWLERHKKVGEMVEAAMNSMEPINLPHAGETMQIGTYEEAALQLENLRSLGYRVPQRAIDALREEAKEKEAPEQDL